MVITVADAVLLAEKGWAMMAKLYNIIKSGVPGTIEEEIAALEAARLQVSDAIIAQADAASKK